MCFDSGQHLLWAMFIEEIWRNPNVKFHTVSFQLVTTPHYLLLATLFAIFLHRGHMRLMELKYNMWTHISKNDKKIHKDNVCVCVNMFLKSWENLEQCMYPIHWAPPLSLSSLEFTLVVHLARGRDGVVAPKILERQTKMGKSFGNHGKSMKSCEYLWGIGEIQIENLWKCVFPQKSPIGRCTGGYPFKGRFWILNA